MSVTDGGPAFPVPSYVNTDGETHESKPQGMSLRDWFAGQALVGVAGRDDCTYRGDATNMQAVEDWRNEIVRNEADYCFRIADAMLAESRKGEK